MSDKGSSQSKADPRPVYEPPRALRLDDARTGAGIDGPCVQTGSSAGDCVGQGSIASGYCIVAGSDPGIAA
jgi:hypothetical protein